MKNSNALIPSKETLLVSSSSAKPIMGNPVSKITDNDMKYKHHTKSQNIFSNVPSPFEKAIVWPDMKHNLGKRKRKDKILTVVTYFRKYSI